MRFRFKLSLHYLTLFIYHLDNAQEFFEWLNNGGTDLSGLRYAVFGLGNKTYEHYNKVAKYLDERLVQLGAERVFELGLGDDDGK